jgi:hypothetical protein
MITCPLALAVGCQALWTLLVTFCIVIIRCTETFWSPCIIIWKDENCALLGYYAASRGNSLPTFRDNLESRLSLEYLTVENGTGRLFRNFGKKLRIMVAQQPSGAHFSCTSRRKPEITHLERFQNAKIRTHHCIKLYAHFLSCLMFCLPCIVVYLRIVKPMRCSFCIQFIMN